ncbi:MAG TPA: hypothetical protein VJP40_01370, partial [bacterium]|nr:hypothetical protein [bacterium]
QWLESKEGKNIEEVTSALWRYVSNDAVGPYSLLPSRDSNKALEKRSATFENHEAQILELGACAVASRLLWNLGEGKVLQAYLKNLQSFDRRVGYDQVMSDPESLRREIQDLKHWKRYSAESPERIEEILHAIEKRLREVTMVAPPLLK